MNASENRGKSIVKVGYKNPLSMIFREQIITFAKNHSEITKDDAVNAIKPDIYQKAFFNVAWNRLIFDDVLIRLEGRDKKYKLKDMF